MKTRQSTRQKVEELKRTCLLKKIRFYEYLIGFGTQKHPIEIQNKTANAFIPTLALPVLDYSRHTESAREERDEKVEDVPEIREESIVVSRPRRALKSVTKESFRLSARETINNIRELTARSMTPAVRINKGVSFNNGQEKLSFIANKSQINSFTTLNPSNQRQNNLRPWRIRHKLSKTLEIVKPRKQSICPWETQVDL